MLQFPVATMVRFCDNHGLLQVNNRPPWFTVAGGAKHYVKAITDTLSDKRLNTPVLGIARDEQGVLICTAQGVERFDQVVLAVPWTAAAKLLPASDPASTLARSLLPGPILGVHLWTDRPLTADLITGFLEYAFVHRHTLSHIGRVANVVKHLNHGRVSIAVHHPNATLNRFF
jgi:hypothetical protein